MAQTAIPVMNHCCFVSTETPEIEQDGIDDIEVEVADRKLTYDRDFLLKFQFEDVCKEKPEGLPDIEVVLDTARPPQKAFVNSRYILKQMLLSFTDIFKSVVCCGLSVCLRVHSCLHIVCMHVCDNCLKSCCLWYFHIFCFTVQVCNIIYEEAGGYNLGFMTCFSIVPTFRLKC